MQVGASEATLLAKLGIKPFSYGLVIRQVPLQGRLPSRIPPCALVQTPPCLCLHPSCSFLMHSIRSIHTCCNACHDGLKQLKSLRCFKL